MNRILYFLGNVLGFICLGMLFAANLHAGGGEGTEPETGTPSYSLYYTISGGPNGPVYALCVDSANQYVYVGGAFTSFFSGTTQGDGHVAALNLNTFAWEELGEGLNGDVLDLVLYQDTLYAAGFFKDLTGIPTGVAKLTDNGWQAVGYLNDTVYALHVHEGSLYAGGRFAHTAPGYSFMRLARLNQGNWSSPGFGFNGSVRSFCSWDGLLVVGGDFNHAGIAEAPYVIGWDGQAPVFLGNPGGPVHALTTFKQKLWAGGPIVSAADTFGLAVLDQLGVPWEQRVSIEQFNHQGSLPASALNRMGFKGLAPIHNAHPDFESEELLYATGSFLYEPSPQLGRRGKNAARMDLIQGLHGDTWADSTVFDIAQVNGMIFLAGAFKNLNGSYSPYMAFTIQEVTGVESLWHPENWGVYPNPSEDGRVYLKHPVNSVQGQEVRLLDLKGSLLWEGYWPANSPLPEAHLLPKGSYMLHLTAHGKRLTWIKN